MKGQSTKHDVCCATFLGLLHMLRKNFVPESFQFLEFLGNYIKNHTPLQFPFIITYLILKIL